MVKTSLIAVLTVLLLSGTFQIAIYQYLTPILIWSNETLYLNVLANRGGWRACKKFRWCGERTAPQWPVIWSGEYRYLA